MHVTFGYGLGADRETTFETCWCMWLDVLVLVNFVLSDVGQLDFTPVPARPK
jgi:hypothetical protein